MPRRSPPSPRWPRIPPPPAPLQGSPSSPPATTARFPRRRPRVTDTCGGSPRAPSVNVPLAAQAQGAPDEGRGPAYLRSATFALAKRGPTLGSLTFSLPDIAPGSTIASAQLKVWHREDANVTGMLAYTLGTSRF